MQVSSSIGGHQFCGIETIMEGIEKKRQQLVMAKNMSPNVIVNKNQSSTGLKLEQFSRMASISLSSVHNGNNRKQLSSFILFLSAIILVNLCPFNLNHEHYLQKQQHYSLGRDTEPFVMQANGGLDSSLQVAWSTQPIWNQIDSCIGFMRLMFTGPRLKLGSMTPNTRIILADARMLGKMAKVWYIKKKIKKLSKKLKKHTIAVPVFTAIPIYEHSYYPPPHVTHVTHGAVHHAAAASSYAPTYAQLASTGAGAMTTAGSQQQQLATSASNNQPVAAYHRPPQHHSRPMYQHHHHHHGSSMHPATAANQIINAYAPSPPLFVDEAGGLYGTYGNAYGRYDGGYQLW